MDFQPYSLSSCVNEGIFVSQERYQLTDLALRDLRRHFVYKEATYSMPSWLLVAKAQPVFDSC